MKELLNTFSIPLLIEIIFYPLVELSKEIDAILLDRHRIRSIIKIFFVITISLSSIYFALYYPMINQFFIKITEVFNISIESQGFVSKFIAITSSCHLGNYIANITIKTFCRFYFGDSEFYVTPKQLLKLEKKFKEQINYDIQGKHIIEVIDFCVKNFRKQNSREIGAKKEDWKNTLESLIYDADLEHFSDQQNAFFAKEAILRKKLEAIKSQTIKNGINKNYSNICSNNYNLENQFNRLSPINTPPTYGSINSPSSALNEMYPKHQNRRKLQQRLALNQACNENTPLLADEKPIATNSSDNIPQDSEENPKSKYKFLHITPPITPPPKSKHLLLEYQKNLLRQQELTTTQKILSAPFVTQNPNVKLNNESGISLSSSSDTPNLQHRM